MSFRHREQTAELMDAPDLPERPHRQALSGLRRVNQFSQTAQRLWRAMQHLAAPGTCLRVLDLGSGGGDILCGIGLRAVRAGVPFVGVGCDISETACQVARARAHDWGLDVASANVSFRRVNCLHDPVPTGFDVSYCSLFLHHFGPQDAVHLLRQLRETSERLVLVDDLVRSAFGFGLAWVGTRLLSRSPIVHVDGPRSVRAAFTLPEVEELARRAQLSAVRITPVWPCRFLLQWSRS